MVYESDFYTTRRPYRYTPSYSTYTTSTVPSRQVRVLPGLGKVHIIHSYDRIVPYVGHKRLTVVTTPPKVYSTRPSVLQREYDWIERKVRPWVSYSATNNYLNSNSAVRIVFNRYPGLWNDSYSSSSLYRKYGSLNQYSSSTEWPCDEYWPYYSSYRYWKYGQLYTPYYKYLRYFSSLPLYRSYYLDSWFDRYIDWCYNYWPRYRSRYSSNLDSISLPYTRRSLWYWPDYNPRRMVYVRSPMTGLYYSNYLPISDYNNYYRINRPLYSYDYWPYTSLNYLTSWWPRYRNYLDDDSSYRALRMQRIFDDETRLIRAQAASLLKSVHLPVPRYRSYPITSLNRYGEYPARLANDHYIHRLMQISPKNSKVEFVTYYTEPVKKYIGQGRLACISYIGDRGAYGRRRNVYVYEDPVKSDIQLLSFYINKFKEEKQQKQAIEPAKVALSPSRPSRRFNVGKHSSDETPQEIRELREARAARLAKIHAEDKVSVEDDALKAKKQREEARLAEEKALAEEQAIQEAKEAKEKKEKAAREAAERAAELERQAELLRQEELAKQAEIERTRKEEEKRLKAEEQKRLAEEARAEEERKQLLRLEEIARQAEEEREAELARQAEELAELARQEAELAEQAKQEAEAAELARQEDELAELKRQEEELAELERQERELEEAAEKAKLEAELASQENSETGLEIEAAEIKSDYDQDVREEVEGEEQIDIPEKVSDVNEEIDGIAQEADYNVEETEQQDQEDPAELVHELEVEDEEPIAEAEDVPAAQGDTADEAEEEEEE